MNLSIDDIKRLRGVKIYNPEITGNKKIFRCFNRFKKMR